MRSALGVIALAVLSVEAAAQSPAPAGPRTMSDIMVKVLYPTADAIFYIETRTPTDDASWAQLQEQTRQLADAAVELTIPRWARGRDKWLADAKLLVDASATAKDAASRRDLKALVELNDALYTSCVQCHLDYRPNYGRRPSAPASGRSRSRGCLELCDVDAVRAPHRVRRQSHRHARRGRSVGAANGGTEQPRPPRRRRRGRPGARLTTTTGSIAGAPWRR
jgi:hypothetical protein